MGKPARGKYGIWQEAQLRRIRKTAADMSRETGIKEAILSKWKLGREGPTGKRVDVVADYFKVKPSEVPTWDEYEVPAPSGGPLPSPSESGYVSQPVRGSALDATRQQEAVGMDTKNAWKAYGIVFGMDDEDQPLAVQELRRWHLQHEAEKARPQPAARRGLSRRSYKR